jgi:hypothetical protein
MPAQRRPDQENQPQKRIAIEAASRLRMTELLEQAAADPAPWLRSLATQHIFYLWQKEPEAAFQALEGLSQRVRGRYGLPDLGVAESLLAISGAVVSKEHDNKVALKRMLSIGRSALRRLLYLNDQDSSQDVFRRAKRVILGFFYNFLVGFILKFALQMMTNWGERATIRKETLANAFKLSEEQKQIVKSLLLWIDPNVPGFHEKITDLIKVEDWGDLMTTAFVEYPFVSRGFKNFDSTLQLAEEMVDYAASYSRLVSGLVDQYCLWQAARKLKNPNPNLLNLAEKYILQATKMKMPSSPRLRKNARYLS